MREVGRRGSEASAARRELVSVFPSRRRAECPNKFLMAQIFPSPANRMTAHRKVRYSCQLFPPFRSPRNGGSKYPLTSSPCACVSRFHQPSAQSANVSLCNGAAVSGIPLRCRYGDTAHDCLRGGTRFATAPPRISSLPFRRSPIKIFTKLDIIVSSDTLSAHLNTAHTDRVPKKITYQYISGLSLKRPDPNKI